METFNAIMELIFIWNGSSMSLSMNQKSHLMHLWNERLTEKGKEVIADWATRNEFRIPEFL